MSIKELKEKAKPATLDLDKLPEVIIAEFTSWRYDKDSTGRECLYIVLTTDKGETLNQKYTPFHMTDLIDAMENLKILTLQNMIGETYEWKQQTYRIGFPRYIPTKKVTT